MITGKIILKSATKLSLDKRFSEIAKQAPPAAPRIQQTANVIIPRSKQELFGARRPATLSIAQRLKKRSINYRLGLNANAVASRPRVAAVKPRVFQRLSFANRRRGRGGSGLGANAYLFGGQSGMGIRLRGQGRIGGTRPTRPRTRGFLNNGAISRYSNNSTRGNRSNTRGRRGGANNNNNNSNNGAGGNFNRFKRGRGGPNASRGRGRNNNNNSQTVSKESLDTDLDKYMSQTKLDNDSVDMNAV